MRPAQAEAARLYAAHRRWVYSLCRSRLGTREDAEDAVQLTFLYAFRSLQRDVLPEREFAWLRTIADNVCRTRRRDAWSRSQFEAVSDVHAVEHLLPARERSDADVGSLRAALELLTEAQRQAVLLREWQGLTYKEIATTLGLSEPAVETLLFRARRRLASSLAEVRHTLNVAAAVRLVRKLGAGGAGKATAAAVVSVGVVATAGPPIAHHFEHASHVQKVRVHAAAKPAPAAAHPAVVRPAAQAVALEPPQAETTATTSAAPDRPATVTNPATPTPATASTPAPTSTPAPAQQPAPTESTTTAATPVSQPPPTDPVTSVVDTASSTASTAVSTVTSTAGQAVDTVTTAVDTVTSALPTVTAPTVTTPTITTPKLP